MSVLALPPRRLRARALLARARSATGTAWVGLTVLLLAALSGRVAFVGGDARWLAALGRVVAGTGIPHGVPFAATPTGGWHNPLVLAELSLYALERAFGDPGLVAAQTVAIGLGLGLLAHDMRRRGAGTGAICLALLLTVCGAATSFAIVRVQLFSLVLFPAVIALLRADARRPSARIWLVLPLLALWSNLHGAVLVGVVVLYAYLLLGRGRAVPRRLETAGVGLLALPALCVTSAGLQTPAYFVGLTQNLAAQRGAGMWVPLGTGPFDVALIVVVVAMAAVALLAPSRPRVWESVTALVLIAATAKASRDGVWLVMFIAAPGAAGLSALAARLGRRRREVQPSDAAPRDWVGLLPPAAALVAALIVSDVAHWSAGATSRAPAPVRRAVALAHGSPILADTVPGEEIALAGGRIWAGNPLDAFSHAVQALFLDFDQGFAAGSAALGLPQIRVVLVTAGSRAARLVSSDPGFRPLSTADGYSLYVRR